MTNEKEFNSVVFVSFENEFAPCGGLAAVMKMLPPVMSDSITTALITPYFQNIPRTKKFHQEGKILSTGLNTDKVSQRDRKTV